MGHPARSLLLGMAVTTLLVSMAAPALAHGRGTDATNYASRVTAAPPLSDVSWQVFGGDELLWMENRSDEELLVYGYQDEPYLRIGPGGVWENRNSEATYLNQERLARVVVPESVDPEAEPEWVRVSEGSEFAWHDHRIHFMGVGLHPRVTDPGERTHIMEWTVPFAVDGQDYEVAGELEWVPGPPPWLWLAVGLAVTLPALLGLRTRPVEGRWHGLARPAAAVLGLVVVVNVSFLIDGLMAVPLPAAALVFAALQTALFLAIGAFGAWRGWQGGDGAFTALGVGAGAIFVGQGLLLWSVLTASQLSTVFPDVVPRLAVGVNIMQVVPLGIVAVVGTQRLLPDLQHAALEDASVEGAGGGDPAA